MKLKKLAAMMAAAAMVFSLAACGGKSNTVESKSVENAAEETMTVDKDKKEIDLLIYQNGVLSPIEIKKSASPGKTAIKNFKVLDPITHEENFSGLESLKVKIGTGSVVCMANDLLPVDSKNWYVPAWLI